MKRWLLMAYLSLAFLGYGLAVAQDQGLLINGSRTLAGTLNAATTTGTATAYLMALNPPITAYVTNQCFTFRAHVTNTGPATLNVNGVGIKPLKKYVGTAVSDLVAGDITSGQIIFVCYDGTVMQLVGAGFAGSGGDGGSLGFTPENVANKAIAPELGTSDTAYPSQKAVKSYVDSGLVGKHPLLNFTPENAANKSNAAALGTSATAYPTQDAVKKYVDTGLAGKQPTLGFTPEDFVNKKPDPLLGTSDIFYPTQNAVKRYVDTAIASGGSGVTPSAGDVRNATAYGVVCDGTTVTSTALQIALDTVPVGTKLVLPAGVCLLSQTLTITRPLTLEGAGMERTFLRQNQPTIPVLTVSSFSVHVTGFTASHSGTPVAGGDGLIIRGPDGNPLSAVRVTDVGANYNWRGFVFGAVGYAQASHLWAMRNNNHGFEFLYDAVPGGGSQQWDIFNVISQQNLGAGFFGHNVAAANGIGPWITLSQSFSNQVGGYVFQGSPDHMISDIRLLSDNASTDNLGGIYLNTYGGSHLIAHTSVENAGLSEGIPVGAGSALSVPSHTGHGIEVTSNNAYGVMIDGGIYWNNSWSGVLLNAPSSQLVGGQSVGNGKAFAPESHKRAGVSLGADNILVTGHTFQFIGDGATLAYIDTFSPITGTVIGFNSYAAGLPAIPMQGPAGGTTTANIPCNNTVIVSGMLQALLDTLPVGTKIALPPGICLLNQTLNVTRTVTLEGSGINHTYLRQTVPNISVLHVGAVNDVSLQRFTADHSGIAVIGGDGIVFDQLINRAFIEYVAADRNWRGFVLGSIAFGSVSHAEASNNNNNGFEFAYGTNGAVQWQVHHTLSQLNKGIGYAGINSTAVNGIGPFLNDTGSFGNDFGGYVFLGFPGTPINDVFLMNVFSSADNRAGIYLDTYGGAHVIANAWVELSGVIGGWPIGSDGTVMVPSQTGNCLSVSFNNQPVNITGGYYWNCSWAGVALDASSSSLTGGSTVGNGKVFDPLPARRAAVAIGGNNVLVSGHTFQFVGDSSTLEYITIPAGVTGTVIGANSYAPGLPAVPQRDPAGVIGDGQGLAETEQAMGAFMGAYIHSGCLPVVPGAGLTFAPFACIGFVHDASSPPRLIPVKQSAAALTLTNNGDGIYWVGLHRDATTLITAWVREAGTHYVWGNGVTPPFLPSGQVIAKVTMIGGVITAVEDLRVPSSLVREGNYNVTDPLYGGIADDAHDIGPPIQAAINAAMAQNGRLVRLPQGTYRQSSGVNIPYGIHLKGDGWAPNERQLQTINTDPRRGTWIHIWSGGYIPFTLVGNGSALTDIAFDQDHPEPVAGWTPVDYPYIIDIATTTTWGQGDLTLTNLFCFKCNNFIRQRSVASQASGRVTMHGIWGQVFGTGIHIEYMADVSRITDVHFWPWWTMGVGVLDWSLTHTTGISLWRADSLNLHNIFVFAANVGILFSPNGFGPTTGLLATNIQLDFVRAGIFHNQPNSNGHFANMRLAGGWDGVTFWPYFEGATSLVMQQPDTRLMVTNLEMLSVGDNCAKVLGAGSVLVVTNLWCRNWNMNGLNTPGIFSGGGAAFHLSGTQKFSDGHGAVDIGGNVNAAVFPGGATFNQDGTFFANYSGNRPTVGFSPGNFLQWVPEANAFLLSGGGGTYNTGGVRKYLCIQDGVLTVGTTCP